MPLEEENLRHTGVSDEKRMYTLEEVTSEPYNFPHIKWDGM